MSPEDKKRRQREKTKAHYEANREEVLGRQKAKRQDPVAGEERRARERERIASLPPEERERRKKANRDWYQNNPRSPEKNAEMHYKHRYRMTPAQREEMITMQNGCCYLCGEPLPEDRRKIHVDHDHSCCPDRSCGECVRGVACDPCNRGVGYFADDPDRMIRVAESLRAANNRVREQQRNGIEARA